MRAVFSVILIVLGCVLAPPALVGFWVAADLADTDSYVKDVAPLANHPDVQDAVVDRVTGAIARPLRKRTLSPAEDLVHTLVQAVVSGKDFPVVWEDVNRMAHRQLIAILSGGDGRMPPVRDDTVRLDLTPVYNLVKDQVNSLVQEELGGPLPDLRPMFELFSSADLARARTAYTWLIRLKWVLPFLSLALLAAGVLLARDRGRALTGAGLGLAASMFLLAAALAVIRDVYLPDYVGPAMPEAAATAVFDALTGSLRAGLRVIFAVGLVVAGVAFFACCRKRASRDHQPAAPANDVAAG
ncbi:hypothetical protein [Streptosporangium roseum]|uniref:Integral membrane protein n=1 Tax=Streptosporangium roseum (strain ATCC 12428 / DSM 43021 / JCM 3005 / KCTC 9067 / NCIMB 10171 / NRRL 2505 / NI 9100) TaxID=479432 RepID=D2BCS2_STRRD|nr:hypothetical protein [Streptosporangium roseum]ACZ91892.1 hypothetical protein Sros_9274 [Streptosporangium roseum DSM 43021]